MSLKLPDTAADAPRWFTALNIFVVTVNGKPICRWKVLSAIIQAVFYFCFAWLTVPLYRRTLCAVKAARRGALFSQFDFAPQRADSRTCRLTFGWKVKVLKLLCAPFYMRWQPSISLQQRADAEVKNYFWKHTRATSKSDFDFLSSKVCRCIWIFHIYLLYLHI